MLARYAFAAGLVGTLIGCATVRPVTRPSEFIPSKHPRELWVTRVDGKEFWLINPRVEGSEVVGWARGRIEQEVRVPLSETRRIEARQTHTPRTALVTGLGLLAGGTFLYLVGHNANGKPGCNSIYVTPAECSY